MAAYSSAGRVPLVIWAATVDPADVPMMRSASVTSTPASDRPAMRPSSHALPAAPAPARTKARLFELPPVCGVDLLVGHRPIPGPWRSRHRDATGAVVELMRGVEEGVVFMGVAFRGLPVGRSQWRLPQSRDRGLQGSTHCGYCVHGSHLLPMDHDRRNASRPATRCAIGIAPVRSWRSLRFSAEVDLVGLVDQVGSVLAVSRQPAEQRGSELPDRVDLIRGHRRAGPG